MFADEQQRLIAFTRVLAVSVLCCLALSWKLWVSRTYYPLVPVFDSIPALPFPLDYGLFGLLVGLLVGIIVWPRSRVLVGLVLATFGLLFLQDQNRLWPSFYEFCFLFLLLVSSRKQDGSAGDQRILAGMRFVSAMIYVWGGVQKLNWHFFSEEFPLFVQPVTERLPFELLPLVYIAIFAALFEVAIGVGLLTRRFRHAALAGAMLMHLLIVVCIGPLRDNWNNSSWMWGMCVAVQTFTLFYRAPAFSFKTMFAGPRLNSIPQWLAVLLIGIMPALNNANHWDSALSFNVYSGNVDYAEIHLQPDVVRLLPAEIARVVDSREGAAVLVLDAWSRQEFNANTYPETRIFKALFAKVGSHLPAGSAKLYVGEKAGWFFPKQIDRYEINAQGGVELSETDVAPPG